jgi:GMP synthase-like glutamine amidotransferase
VQYHHKQEVVRNEGLLKHFEVTAASEGCAVEAMRHRRRDWFGVQFHPETGKDTEAGITARHAEAVRDGGRLLADFVRYCLAPAAKPE